MKNKFDLVWIILGILLLVLTNGCAGGGPSKAIPNAQLNADAIGEHVQAADTHIEAALGHVSTAQSEVRIALPQTTQPATGHLQTADAELTKANADAAAARAEAKEALADKAKLSGDLTQAATDYANAKAEAAKYKEKYDNQWFAGKFWTAFWWVMVILTVSVLALLALNYYTDLFVIPLQHIGKWLADMLASTWKAIRNIFAGVWNEIAGLFKKKPVSP